MSHRPYSTAYLGREVLRLVLDFQLSQLLGYFLRPSSQCMRNTTEFTCRWREDCRGDYREDYHTKISY